MCHIMFLTGGDVSSRRAHQAEVARQCLETRLGAHAAELAERDSQVAYLSSAVGLAEDLLTAKNRWANPTALMATHLSAHRQPCGYVIAYCPLGPPSDVLRAQALSKVSDADVRIGVSDPEPGSQTATPERCCIHLPHILVGAVSGK